MRISQSLHGKDFGATVQPMPTRETLALRAVRRIKEEMDRRGLSQGDVAGLLETDQPRLSRILNGHQSLTVNDLEALCFAVGIQPSEAVRDHGLEFCAEMTPTELRALEQLRRVTEPTRAAILHLLEVKLKTAQPERHAGALPTQKYKNRRG